MRALQGTGRQVPLRERRDGIPEHGLFFGQIELHQKASLGIARPRIIASSA
ncbi:hypothetical protein ACFSTI_25635 [Rhizorhabdus histidinilytica]